MNVEHQWRAAVNHIESRPGVCEGKACVAGTRIRVWDIHVWHDLQGLSPAEIIADFPRLSVADVYAALAYYHDYREEIEQQAREDAEVVATLEAAGADPLHAASGRTSEGDGWREQSGFISMSTSPVPSGLVYEAMGSTS